jgi:RNA 3'-terminal phosphate cyclase (ATP)
MIELDGSYGEGGGALVRTALALSTITGKEFKIINIRSGRNQPGLKAQHLHSINALKEICNAETNEIELGSTELWFKPGKIKSGIFKVDIETAGSITLLLQALILPCLFAPNKVTLKVKGGTCGKWQASVDFLQNVLLPHIQRFVEKIELKVIKRGYYPKGNGEISLEINPRFKITEYESFSQFNEDLIYRTAKIDLIKQGEIEQIRGIVNVSKELEDKEVGERIKRAAQSSLNNFNVPMNIRVEYVSALSVGGEINLWAIFSQNGRVDFDNPVIIASEALVERNQSSEHIGKNVAEKLKKEIESEAATDEHLADQLISFMALLPESQIKTSKVSEHTHTNIYVVEKFLAVGFKVDGDNISVKQR